MRALLFKAIGEMEMGNIPQPEGEFVVDVISCGICGTDLKAFLQGHRSIKPPTVLGHETIGVVSKAPEEAGYKPGDYVIVAPYGECGKCKTCLEGYGEMCSHKPHRVKGGFCEKVEVPIDFVRDGIIKIPEPDDVYTLVEPLACVLCGIKRMDLLPESKILIVGGGPMGNLFALLAQSMGNVAEIVEPEEIRRKYSEMLGIKSHVPGDVDVSQFDRIVIAVNKPEIISDYIKNVGDAGVVLIFSGLPKGAEFSVDAAAIHYREVTISGTSGYSIAAIHEAAEIIKKDPDHFKRLITHEFPLEKGPEAFEMMRKGETLKIVLKP